MLVMEEAIEEAVEVEVSLNLNLCKPLAIVATERYDGWHECLAKRSEIWVLDTMNRKRLEAS